MDWAGEIHEEVDTAIDRFVSFVRVNTGDEGRPAGAGFVLWVGGETQPTNMSGGDIWMSEGEPVPVAPTITTTAMNTMYVSISFSQTLVATGSSPITWAVTAGSLPAGLSLNTSTGAITGTPTTAAAYSFTITATNSTGSDGQAYTGSVAASPTPPTVTTTTLTSMTQGVSFSETLAATGDTPMTWAVTGGTLPAGLSLNASTGAITGTPSGSGSYSFTVTATNSAGSDGQAFSGTITAGVVPPNITTTSLSTVTVSSYYTRTLTATGGTPITWALTVGSLPAGLSLNTSTGVIDGTPTTAGAYTFTIGATNSAGTDTQAFSGTVSPAAYGQYWFGPSNTPDSSNLFTDGGANIIVADHFFAYPPISVLGVRVWNPATAPSGFLTADCTVYGWARDWDGTAFVGSENPGWSTPDQSKTLTDTRVAGEWTNIYFDAPINLGAMNSAVAGDDCILLGVHFASSGYYVVTTDAVITGSLEIESAQADEVYLGWVGMYRAAFTLNGTTGSEPGPSNRGTWYGIDMIYELL